MVAAHLILNLKNSINNQVTRTGDLDTSRTIELYINQSSKAIKDCICCPGQQFLLIATMPSRPLDQCPLCYNTQGNRTNCPQNQQWYICQTSLGGCILSSRPSN